MQRQVDEAIAGQAYMDAVGRVESVLDDPSFVNILRDDDILGVEQKMADDQIRIVDSSVP